jgi:hypothetical protein
MPPIGGFLELQARIQGSPRADRRGGLITFFPASKEHAMMQKTVSLALSAILLLTASVVAAPAAAVPKAAPPPAEGKSQPLILRQQAIHIAYNEGDFERVVAEIEAFQKANKTFTRGDSIFISKHLAVVYTANPNTREKGKYYMYRLLEMVPSAELVDMFVSDEIDRIFDRVRKEFLTRQQGFGVDSTQMSLPDRPGSKPAVAAAEPAPAAKPETTAVAGSPFYKKKGFWMMTGAGIAATAAVVTFVHNQEEAGGTKFRIPAQ